MITAVVVGNGRPDCLARTVKSLRDYLPRLDAYVMVDDSGDPDHHQFIRDRYTDFHLVLHPENRGMAAAVQAAWNTALAIGSDYIWHNEDDMELITEIPITRACQYLSERPDLAQLMFRRQPLNPEEQREGCVLAATCNHATDWSIDHPDYTTQNWIFSLNPCVIPRRVLELGWPSGPLGVGNESGMTKKLLAAGCTFGAWGHPLDGQQHVEHIGAVRGAKWQL